MFRLKNLEVLEIDPKLAKVAEEIKERFDLCTITCGRRDGDTGVHGTTPLRGLDLRCRDFNVGIIVERWVNARWKYDFNRPHKKVVWCHDTGKGVHLHVQVHPNTIRRNNANT